MSDERVRVLQMLEQGLITYEQSLALLRALGEDSQTAKIKSVKGAGLGTAADADEDYQGSDEQGEDDEGFAGHADDDEDDDHEDDHEDEDDDDHDDEDADEDEDADGFGGAASARLHAASVVAEVRQSLGAAYREAQQALSQAAREARHGRPQISRELRETMQEVAGEISEAMQGVGEELRDAFSEVQQSGGFGFGLGRSHTFRSDEQLPVSPTVHILDLTIITKNGNVKVAAGDGAEIRLQTVKKIQADSRQAAEETAKIAVERTLQEDGERLRLELRVPELVSGVAVNFELQIPKRLLVAANILSKNGGIYLEELQGTAQLESKNGELRILGGSYRSLQAETKNGSAKLMATVQEGNLITKNGSLRCLLKPQQSGRLNLESKNGSIVLELPHDPRQGYSLDAASLHGAVHIDLKDFQPSLSERRHQQGQTVDFQSKEQQLTISANTKNGSVTIKTLV